MNRISALLDCVCNGLMCEIDAEGPTRTVGVRRRSTISQSVDSSAVSNVFGIAHVIALGGELE